MVLKKIPYESPKIRTKTIFFFNLFMYGQICRSGNTGLRSPHQAASQRSPGLNLHLNF